MGLNGKTVALGQNGHVVAIRQGEVELQVG